MLKEIRAVAGDGPILPEHIERLGEVAKFAKETMRLYPPVPIILRMAKRDLELGGKRIAAGSLVFVLIFAVHRHRALWADPDRFDPDRFSAEREAPNARYRFIPFGAGARTCIGASFAMVEIVAMLATLLRAARFEVAPQHRPVPVSRVTLWPRGGMPLKVSLRDATAVSA